MNKQTKLETAINNLEIARQLVTHEILYIDVLESELKNIEKQLIKYYMPKYNIIHNKL